MNMKRRNNLEPDDVLDMLIEACEEVRSDQEGKGSGNVITRILGHSDAKKNVPVNVKEIRELYGLTQDQMATAICMTPSTIKHWEQGKRTPRGTSKIVLEAMAIVAEKRMKKAQDSGDIPEDSKSDSRTEENA